jgi:hypothetical protein
MTTIEVQKPSDALTVRETAAKLGVSIRQVMGLIREDKLANAYKFGLLLMIPKQSVENRIRQVETWKAGRSAAQRETRQAIGA